MRREDGFTVVETLVVAILVVAVAFIAYGFIDSTTTTTARTNRNVQAEKDAHLALRVITQDIRAANPISATHPSAASPSSTTCDAGSFPSAYSTCLRFVMVSSTSGSFCIDPEVGRVGAPYSRITYGLKNGAVLQDRTDYSATCSVVRSYTGRSIVERVVNATTSPPTPLFTYYTEAGQPITSLTTSNVVNAGAVEVALALSYQNTGGAQELLFKSTASLRNNR